MATSAKTAAAEKDARPMIEKFSPVTGEKLGEYPIEPPEVVNAAVERAQKAFVEWRERSLKERLDVIAQIKDVVREDGEHFARRISEDTGKPYFDSLLTELMAIPLFIEHYEKTAPSVLARKRVKNPIVFPFKKSYIEHFPIGVVAVIAPWNFPFQLSMIPTISALIAGNTVVLKPSEVTPITGDIIQEIFDRIDIPEGVFEMVHGDGSTGAALCEADVDKIFFTGSVETGRKVMAAAAKKPIPVELELGGKDAFIVCHDANLERAARACVWAAMVNCGQMCTSVERVFVVDSVYDEFMSKVMREVQKVRVGGPDEDADMGPVTFTKQLKTIESHISSAREEGATIAFGGNALERDGQFFEPTIVTDVTEDMTIYREETFGPVMPVIRVKSEEEAIRMANNHKFGLTGSVWTKDLKRGIELASRMESGQCSVNDVVQSVGNPALPFGGVKASGIGRYHGDEGLLSFTHTKAIMVDYGKLSSEPFWFPYEGKYPEMVKAFKALLDGKLPRALWSLVKMR